MKTKCLISTVEPLPAKIKNVRRYPPDIRIKFHKNPQMQLRLIYLLCRNRFWAKLPPRLGRLTIYGTEKIYQGDFPARQSPIPYFLY